MIFKINKAITLDNDNSKHFRVNDVVDVTTNSGLKFTGKIDDIDYESFTIDCGTTYNSNSVVLLLSDIKSIVLNTDTPSEEGCDYIIGTTYR